MPGLGEQPGDRGRVDAARQEDRGADRSAAPAAPRPRAARRRGRSPLPRPGSNRKRSRPTSRRPGRTSGPPRAAPTAPIGTACARAGGTETRGGARARRGRARARAAPPRHARRGQISLAATTPSVRLEDVERTDAVLVAREDRAGSRPVVERRERERTADAARRRRENERRGRARAAAGRLRRDRRRTCRRSSAWLKTSPFATIASAVRGLTSGWSARCVAGDPQARGPERDGPVLDPACLVGPAVPHRAHDLCHATRPGRSLRRSRTSGARRVPPRGTRYSVCTMSSRSQKLSITWRRPRLPLVEAVEPFAPVPDADHPRGVRRVDVVHRVVADVHRLVRLGADPSRWRGRRASGSAFRCPPGRR